MTGVHRRVKINSRNERGVMMRHFNVEQGCYLFLVLGVFSLLAGLDLNLPIDIEDGNFFETHLRREGSRSTILWSSFKPVWCGLLVSHNLLRLQEVGPSSEQVDLSHRFTKVERSPATCTGLPQR